MIDGEGYEWTTKRNEKIGMPTHDGTSTMTGNTGNGYAKITFKQYAGLSEAANELIRQSVQNTWYFEYMGYYQVFTAPKTGTYKIELWGAQGGTTPYNGNAYGGYGAYTKGNIGLTKGSKLYIYVGETGMNNLKPTWNGGGFNYSGSNDYSAGGGATDIRIASTSENTLWNEIDSLKTRIMVAAGGGGASGWACGQRSVCYGGHGGGLYSEDALLSLAGANYTGQYNTGATQTAGGQKCERSSNVSNPGGFGYGGAGGANTYSLGGGSGWFGGAGGCDLGPVTHGTGGSSYISGHDGSIGVNEDTTMKTNDSVSYTGYKFTSTKMIDGYGYSWTTTKGSLDKMPTHDGETLMNGNQGNGYAKITFIN